MSTASFLKSKLKMKPFAHDSGPYQNDDPKPAGRGRSKSTYSSTQRQPRSVSKDPKAIRPQSPDKKGHRMHPYQAVTRPENATRTSAEKFDIRLFAATHPTSYLGAVLLAHLGEIESGWTPEQAPNSRTLSYKTFEKSVTAHVKSKYLYAQVSDASETEKEEELDRPIRGCIDHWVTELLHEFLRKCQDSGYSNAIKNWNCLISMPKCDSEDAVNRLSQLLNECKDRCLKQGGSVVDIRTLRGEHWELRQAVSGRAQRETLIAIDIIVASAVTNIAERHNLVYMTPLLNDPTFSF